MKSFKILDHLFEEIPAKNLDRHFICHTCKSELSFSIFYSYRNDNTLTRNGSTLTIWTFFRLPSETFSINARHRTIIPCSGVKMEDALT